MTYDEVERISKFVHELNQSMERHRVTLSISTDGDLYIDCGAPLEKDDIEIEGRYGGDGLRLVRKGGSWQ